MFSDQRMGFCVIFLVLPFNGLEACFRKNEHFYMSLNTGNSIYKECQCTELGYSMDDLRWTNNGVVLGPGTNNSAYTEVQSDIRSLNLLIPNITKTMSGTYTCETKVDGRTYTQSHTIAAYDRLYFYDTPRDQHLVHGHSSEIRCQPKSDSPVDLTWYKENNSDFYQIWDDDKYTAETDRLIIHNVTDEDAGKYKCIARVIVTMEEVGMYIEVKVLKMPKITGIKATPESYPITVIAGMNLTIECIADGTPHPEYYWNKTAGDMADEQRNKTYHQEINAIIFDSIEPEDVGIYTCTAYNLAGTASKDMFVEVLVPPYVMDFPNITGVEGDEVQLVCNATGKPSPVVSITYEGSEEYMKEGSDEHVTDTGTRPNMDMIMLDRSKEGIYVCHAANEVNSSEAQMYLTVLHRPYFDVDQEKVWGWEGKNIKLDCQHDSNPNAEITWRFHGNNNIEQEVETNRRMLETLNKIPEPYLSMTIDNETTYGVYECIAENVYGKAVKRITLEQAFKPGPIGAVVLDDVSATSATFKIIGPEKIEGDGPQVIGYTATFDEAKNYNITDIHINRTWASGIPYKLEKLKPNTTYYISFAAVNEVGIGNWTVFYDFNTLEKSVPEPPIWNEDPIILARNSHVLKWRAPDDNGDAIDYYTLRYCSEEDNKSCKTKQILPATEVELVDLEFNTTYYLELIAHNSNGDSIPANITTFVPAPQYDLPTTLLPSGAIIGISIVIVLLCLLLLDVLLLVWRRQGIIATCCFKKDNKRKETALNSRDKKVLLTNGESEDRPGSINNGHREFEYNKSTGVITGKHSAV